MESQRVSILGVIVRARAAQREAVAERIRAMPGADLAIDSGDGRMVVVIEDAAARSAAETLADIALWSNVLNTSLVYEHSETA